MALAVRALSGDVACLATLRDGLHGRVHSVFARVVNVLVPEGTLLTLASREVDDAPDTLVVDLPDVRRPGVSRSARRLRRATASSPSAGALAIRFDGARPGRLCCRGTPHRTRRCVATSTHCERTSAGLDRGPDGVAPPQSSAVAIAATARLAQHATALGRALARGDLRRPQVRRAKRWSGWARG